MEKLASSQNLRQGVEVALLLCEAFRRGLIFQVGTSVTNGTTSTTVWNGIHHKTNTHGLVPSLESHVTSRRMNEDLLSQIFAGRSALERRRTRVRPPVPSGIVSPVR
jgi:hypothetical protein